MTKTRIKSTSFKDSKVRKNLDKGFAYLKAHGGRPQLTPGENVNNPAENFNYSGAIIPNEHGALTKQQDHVARLRDVAFSESLDNYDTYVEFMDRRFPDEYNRSYMVEWAHRFKSGDPTLYMDGKSKEVYKEILERKYFKK